MADRTPPAPPPTPPAPSQPPPLPALEEEFGTAGRNLPPVKMVAIALAVVAVVLGVYSFLERAKPQGSGAIDDIAVAEVPGQNSVLVAANVSLSNTGQKPLWIHTIRATLKTASGEFSDEAASAVDFDRYFQAFPVLKQHALPALLPETKIQPGAEARGTVVVSFPVTRDAFDQRQSLSVVIQPYDQPVPVVLTR